MSLPVPPRTSPRALLGRAVRSRVVLAAGVVASLVVPMLTVPRLPHVSPWPLLLGLLPWTLGKYLLCPLRWRALTPASLSRRWHLRAYAESELLGLFTPGHVGADLWRVHRLTRSGLARGDAVASVGADRLVGAIGLVAFVAFAGAALPVRMALLTLAATVLALLAALVVHVVRPDLLAGRLPRPSRLAHGLVLSAGYQLSIAALLMGAVAATGHHLGPLALMGAFGASQVAGAVPGPNGASPRDGALVVALVGLGVPWSAALAAVTIKAAIAWLPALTLGGASLLLTRRALRRAGETGLPVAV
ncbi:MAG: lysylphosphatidylglycerol synthase domain-containing protein [Nocardioides sp.]